MQIKAAFQTITGSRDQCLPGGLDLSPEILGLVDKELAGLSQRTEKILLQTQLVAILEDLPAVNIGLNTSSKEEQLRQLQWFN